MKPCAALCVGTTFFKSEAPAESFAKLQLELLLHAFSFPVRLPLDGATLRAMVPLFERAALPPSNRCPPLPAAAKAVHCSITLLMSTTLRPQGRARALFHVLSRGGGERGDCGESACSRSAYVAAGARLLARMATARRRGVWLACASRCARLYTLLSAARPHLRLLHCHV